MKQAPVAGVLGLACLLALGSARASTMMVTDLQGRAERPDGRALTMLHQLSSGDGLQLGESASLVLTDLGSGREFVLQGPGRFTVDGGAVRGDAASGPVESRSLALSGLPPVRASTRIALAAVRMRSSLVGCPEALDPSAQVLEPDMTAVAPPVTELRWPAAAGAQAYRVSLADDSGRVLASTTTGALTWNVPSDIAWGEGQAYTWQVQPMREAVPSGQVQTASFSILSSATASMLEALAPSDDAPISRRVLYAAQLQEAGVLRQACREWQRIRSSRPGDAGIARLLK